VPGFISYSFPFAPVSHTFGMMKILLAFSLSRSRAASDEVYDGIWRLTTLILTKIGRVCFPIPQ
jgi:hypothetical protein